MRKKLLFPCLLLVLALLCGCSAVSDAEAAIDAIGKVTPESLSTLEAVEALLDELSDNQLDQVDNLDDFHDAQEDYEEMMELLAEAEEAINDIGTVTPDSEDAIRKARNLYNELEDEDLSEYVEHVYPVLTDAEAAYQDAMNLLDEAREAINAIGTVTLDSKDELENAWKALDKVEKADLGDFFTQEAAQLQTLEDQYQELERRNLYDLAVFYFEEGDLPKGLSYTKQLREDHADSGIIDELAPIAVDAIVKEAKAAFKSNLLQTTENLLKDCRDHFPAYSNQDAAYNEQLDALNKKLESIRPKTGKVLKDKTGNGYGTMHITAGNQDTLIKLENINNPDKYKLVYIRAGETATFNMYSGSYTLKYATGDQWYGLEEMFGDDTVFTKVNDIMEFTITYRGNYVYYNEITITLRSTFGGNLTSDEISADDF